MILLFAVIMGLASCTKEDTNILPIYAEQTILIYMPWSSNLISYFYANIYDIEKAFVKKNSKNERVLVFLSTSPTEAVLFEIICQNESCVRKKIKSYNSLAFTTCAGITSILNDVKSNAPAKRFAMVVGGHGLSWIPVSSQSNRAKGLRRKDYWEYEDVPLTRYFGGLENEYKTEVSTLATGIADAGIKMEYILFDCCYMSSIEVAYELKDVTKHIIASPTEIMAYGFPYSEIGEYMIRDINYQKIAQGFLSFYKNESDPPCGTVAITVCSELDSLASVMCKINERFTFDYTNLNAVQSLDGYSPTLFFDLGSYVSQLCMDEELLKKFEEQLERAVPVMYRKYTPTYYTMSSGQLAIQEFSGITISDASLNIQATSKENTSWYRVTHPKSKE